MQASEKGHPLAGAAVPVRREGQTLRLMLGVQPSWSWETIALPCSPLLISENQLTKEIHSFQSPKEELRRALNLRDNS